MWQFSTLIRCIPAWTGMTISQMAFCKWYPPASEALSHVRPSDSCGTYLRDNRVFIFIQMVNRWGVRCTFVAPKQFTFHSTSSSAVIFGRTPECVVCVRVGAYAWIGNKYSIAFNSRWIKKEKNVWSALHCVRRPACTVRNAFAKLGHVFALRKEKQ